MGTRSRNTRVALFQALLPASIDPEGYDLEATKAWLRRAGFLEAVDKKRFNRWLTGIAGRLHELDEMFQPFLRDRSLGELGHAERTVLRSATYELRYTNVPRAVAINEWVDITKAYGAENSFRFVNGVLDELDIKVCLDAPDHE